MKVWLPDRYCSFTIFVFKTNRIALDLQYFIGLRGILCYVIFQIWCCSKTFSRCGFEVALPGA
jgi:hypothetical protein